MRYYWLQDGIEQGQYNVHWTPVSTNHTDQLTKHFLASHHIDQRPLYLHQEPP
jgi:hypothetical protein